jgi:hypothetical protein
MPPRPSKDQVPAGFDWSACPLPSQPEAEPRKAENPYDDLADKVAQNVAVSGYDFDAPEWLHGDVPCPVFPGSDVRETPQRNDTVKIKLTTYLDTWLADQGYRKELKPGYLGLIVDATRKTDSRAGKRHNVRLGERHFQLFNAIFGAGVEGVAPADMRDVYGGTGEACRNAVKQLRHDLECLQVTITKRRRWKLIEKKEEKSPT